jgi:hypothetical protein
MKLVLCDKPSATLVTECLRIHTSDLARAEFPILENSLVNESIIWANPRKATPQRSREINRRKAWPSSPLVKPMADNHSEFGGVPRHSLHWLISDQPVQLVPVIECDIRREIAYFTIIILKFIRRLPRGPAAQTSIKFQIVKANAWCTIHLNYAI